MRAFFSVTLKQMAIGAGLLSATSMAALADGRLHHDLDMALDPVRGSVEITDRIEVSGHEHLAIRLAAGLTLETIAIDGETVEASEDNGVTWIDLPSSDDHQVELSYGGVLESADTGRTLSSMIAAEGAFLPYGIGWLANGGAEDDRVTYSLRLDVPAPYKAVATGSLTEEANGDDRYSATFTSAVITEPPSVFVGDYRIDERQHGEIRLRTYFPADQQSLSATYLDQAAGYIDRFAEGIGAYPYDAFSMIAAPLPVGLGFPGLTYFSSQILRMPFMQTRSLAHEILHNWWANGVFIDPSEGNWAEGLTTYMADYAIAEAESEDAAWQMRLGWLRDFAALPAERDQPISSFRSKGHDADQVVGYNKAAMVFHMLRKDLGDDTFAAGLQDFWERHQFKTAGWSDLQASFEGVSGKELDGFFAPWLQRKGAPALSLKAADVREREGGYALDVQLTIDDTAYDLNVPLQIETEAGIERRTVPMTDGQAEATFDLTDRPLGIAVDQRHDLFRKLAADEAPPILRDVTLHPETRTVIAVDGSNGAADIAEQLAARTLDTGMHLASADDDAVQTSPLMLIGVADDMDPVLAKAGIDTVPNRLEGRGTSRSWVTSRGDAPPALVVQANDHEALSALLRPLPHYGRQSFLVFEGRQVVDKGVWPTADNDLTRRFD